MHSLEDALVKVSKFFNSQNIPYMVIGGVANLFWGTARSTLDIDITVQIDAKDHENFIRKVQTDFSIRVTNPRSFIDQTRVLPIQDLNGIRIDLIFASLPYEMSAIKRARSERVQGEFVRVCTPEDLIIHKIISERPRDREDIQGVIQKIGSGLDRNYLDPIIEELANAFAKPSMLDFYLKCFKPLDST